MGYEQNLLTLAKSIKLLWKKIYAKIHTKIINKKKIKIITDPTNRNYLNKREFYKTAFFFLLSLHSVNK